ncbi:hypothetical protein [Sporohalobacter salinus]|uniref:hypothetical protein n=1 Tax=Sporohalobacter salinus TaxID=1494606 RepID=UPI00195F5C12|nr:hypothetical protein [Sporohalobacter salinus]MBM7625072.1 hypothetical protein [Sporohalobacter salinus]
MTTDDRYDKGVCVLYRLSIRGDFPVEEQPIAIKAGPELFTFSCSDCYIVSGCPLEPEILVNQTCEKVIEDNKATLNYSIDVTNPGEINLPDVQFEDQITYDAANITVGNVETDPSLSVDTSNSGIINISGDLGSLDSGELTTVIIKVPINSIEAPGI